VSREHWRKEGTKREQRAWEGARNKAERKQGTQKVEWNIKGIKENSIRTYSLHRNSVRRVNGRE